MELVNINIHAEGEYSETLADVNVTFPEEPSKSINDGDILLYKLADLFQDNGMNFISDHVKVLFGNCLINDKEE